MDKVSLEKKLESIKHKQEKLDSAWKKTGNKDLLQFFIDIMPKVLDVERCSIFILDPEEDTAWLQCGTGLSEKQVSVPTKGSVVGRVISSGKPWMDMEMESSVGEHDVVSMKTGFVARNTLCVPVFGVSTDTVTGAIQVLNKHAREYTEEDKATLDRLASAPQARISGVPAENFDIRIKLIQRERHQR